MAKFNRAFLRAGGRTNEPHMHWAVRAGDYKQLADASRNAEVRQVLDHLAMVCSHMTKATDPRDQTRPQDRWLHPNEVKRESTAARWRIREAEYRAVADNCTSDDGRLAWTTIANRCAELADYLERTRD
jgi:hypothetical protein